MSSTEVQRRGVLRGLMALGGLALTKPLAGCAPMMAGPSNMTPPGPGRWWELPILEEPVMTNQLLWNLGLAQHRLTDIGECLSTASRIRGVEDVQWFEAWLATAERVRAVGEASDRAGHALSAGQTLLRASQYYRAALIRYPRPDDPRLRQATEASERTYDRAIELLRMPARRLRIPYESTFLHGYFYRTPASTSRAPTIVLHQGFHAHPEETMWAIDGGMRRGYNVLAFHGPGQGAQLRLHNMPFRHDWERVVSPVVDFALTLPEVDPNALILKGLSMGGALAPRAAAFEPRLNVCVANPGVLDWYGAMLAKLGEFPGLLEALRTSPEAFNAAVGVSLESSPAAKWWFRDATWKHGAASPADLLHKLREYTNVPIVERIRCKTLVMDGVDEEFSVGQAQRLYDALRCPKHYMLFDAQDTGQLHCQTGALAVAEQRMFDWLDENL